MTGNDAALTADDRLDILAAVGGNQLNVDLRRWDRVVEFMAPEVTTDYTSVFPGTPTTKTARELVDGWASRLPGFDATQHVVTQSQITGSGNRAQSMSNLRAAHWIGGRIWAFGGAYHHTLRKIEGVWLIDSIRIDMLYEEGDRAVREEAVARMASRLGSAD